MPTFADKQGPGLVAPDAEEASDVAGCATGESRVFADLGQETSRRMKAGATLGAVASGRAYSLPSESGCFGLKATANVGADGMERLAGGDEQVFASGGRRLRGLFVTRVFAADD